LHFTRIDVDAPAVTQVDEPRRRELGRDVGSCTAAAGAAAAGLVGEGFGTVHADLDRNVRHPRVLLHAAQQATDRRQIADESIREEPCRRQHHRAGAEIGAKTLHD
jgi:hypothetical protein